MPFQTAIVGLGIVGSSIGLALKETGADFQILGHDKDAETAKQCLRKGCVDRAEWNLINACEHADLVVITTPLGEIKTTLQAIGSYLKSGCVVTDTASVKAPVLAWAREALPPNVHFVGGHPIAAMRMPWRDDVESTRDPDTPSAAHFHKGIYCLTPATDAPPEALQTVSDLAQAVGANPYFLDAAEHDGLNAGVEGLPLLLAVALQATASSSPSWREMLRLAGADYAAVTQRLRGEAGDLAELLTLNAANNQRWIDAFLNHLSALRELLTKEDDEQLRGVLADALEAHAGWTHQSAQPASVDYSDFGVTRMMFGDMFKPRKPKEG